MIVAIVYNCRRMNLNWVYASSLFLGLGNVLCIIISGIGNFKLDPVAGLRSFIWGRNMEMKMGVASKSGNTKGHPWEIPMSAILGKRDVLTMVAAQRGFNYTEKEVVRNPTRR